MRRTPHEREIVSPQLEQDIRRNRRIVPSNPDVWFGSWEDGEDLTFEQKRALVEAGITEPELMDVFIRVTSAQIWSPIGRSMPWRRIVCPVVQHRADGRRMVISPIGDRKIVHADGSLKQSKPVERGGFWRRRP